MERTGGAKCRTGVALQTLQRTDGTLHGTRGALQRTGGALERTSGAKDGTGVALQRNGGALQRTGSAIYRSIHVLPLEPAAAHTAGPLMYTSPFLVSIPYHQLIIENATTKDYLLAREYPAETNPAGLTMSAELGK